MTAKLNFNKQELMVLREAIHSITIKGSDAVLVGAALGKIYKALEDLDVPEIPDTKIPSADSTKK